MAGLRIEGVIDMHCHYGPDLVNVSAGPGHGAHVTALDAAREARDSGHRAIVLKSHSLPSPTLAHAIEEATPGLRVFGGACTDYPSGGLNPDMVEACLKLGGKIIWLPTLHSHQDYLNGMAERTGIKGEGLTVTDEDGEPSEVVREIFALVRENDAVLATGHVTAAEHFAVAKAFAREGKVLVTHAGEHLAGPKLTAQQCRELADLGAVIELTALSCQAVFGTQGKSPEEMVKMMGHVGCERCALATDYGWSATDIPHPAPGFRDFMETLWSLGVSEADLTTMAARNPARLLGL
ncbi:MAG: hypothetical protein JO127_15835 [Caulobacteraceae bacterium]|nr:hypothetical protein [Caulobacteraceae bacterium]